VVRPLVVIHASLTHCYPLLFLIAHNSFNKSFTSKVLRIKIPLPPVDEKKKVIEDVDKDRKYAIDAAIVRVMKSRKVRLLAGFYSVVSSTFSLVDSARRLCAKFTGVVSPEAVFSLYWLTNSSCSFLCNECS